MSGRSYTARRAGQRWREGAPGYVLDCFDNRGKTADRYTVMFQSEGETFSDAWVPYLGMSAAPSDPVGVSLWGEMRPWEASRYRYASGKERVRWLDLPENIRAHVIARYTEV